MKNHLTLILLATALTLASCTPADVPPPAVVPQGELRYLPDPRIGAEQPPTPQVAQKFETAWRYLLAGNYPEARRRFDELSIQTPGYSAIPLAKVALEIREGRFDVASGLLAQLPDSPITRTYAAELAYGQKQIRHAYDLYREIAKQPDATPAARERLAELETLLYQELYAAALAAPDAESIALLREALALNPAASAARVLLVQKLVAQKRWDDARTALDPLLSSGEVDRNEVQEALAEIDAGRGRFQEAIVRYERLARRSSTEPRYQRRLEEIKEQWSAANMPPQFQRALESEAITRSDFAVLLYWKVSPVRFAQNLRTPPIATDVSDVAGREEIIRAMAIGLYDVDPVTRRVSPHRAVNAASLSRLASRVLTLRGASCAAKLADPTAILNACGVPDATTELAADSPVNGRTAARVLEQVNRALQ